MASKKTNKQKSAVSERLNTRAVKNKLCKGTNEVYEQFFNLSIDMLAVAGFDGYFKKLNPHWEKTLGWTDEELLSRPYLEFVHIEDRDSTINAAKGIEEGKPVITFENRYLCKDGSYRWISWNCFPRVKEKLIFAVARDITKMKQMEESQRKTREELEERVGVRTDELTAANLELQAEIAERRHVEEKIIRLYSFQTAIGNINHSLLMGEDSTELFQKICYLLTEVEDIKFVWIGLVEKGSFDVKPVAQAGFEEGYLSSIKVTWDDTEYGNRPTGTAIKTGQPFVMRDIENDPRYSRWRKNAVKWGYASSIAVPLMYNGKVLGALNVYSGRKDAFGDEEIGFLKEVADDIAIGLKSRIMGKSLENSEKRYRHLIESVTDYIYTVKIENYKPVATTHGPGCVTVTGYTSEEYAKDPNQWYHMIYEEDKKSITEHADKILSGETAPHIEHRIIHKDGSIRWVKNTMVPHYDEKGILVAYDGLITDITERKKLEGQLRQSQKMEAIGRIAGGIAHDFNNILTAIIGYASLLQMKMRKDDPLRRNAEQVITSAERAANLTQSLLAFSRKQISNPLPVNLNKIINRVESLLLRVIGEDIELKTMLSDKDLTVMADHVQTEQVLMNLATNARDAMPEGGLLTIETSTMEIDEEYVKVQGYGKLGRYALISVTDSGIGMDEKIKARIFEPFFTTKEIGKGTGLGLSIVYGIVKQHNGYINCYSEQGKGTTFRICLPIIKGEVKEIKQAGISAQIGGTETVLVAEDEEEVRELTKVVLEEFGYSVIEAVNGDDAVKKFMENKDKVQLLLLDVKMPKMSGKEAYDRIRKIKPDIKTLFASGYPADYVYKKDMLGAGGDFVSKPISPTELLKKVREVLDKKSY